MRERVKNSFLKIPMPKQLPPYSALHIDPEQLLWVVLSTSGDPDTRLRCLRSDGRVIADVRIPVALTVFEIGLDYVLGGYEDEEGEPYVAVYRLRRDSGALPSSVR